MCVAEKKLPNYEMSVLMDSDYTFSEGIGHTFNLSETSLGKGSYGDVLLATDDTGRKLAVKCCPLNKSGIPNILETSIMSGISHPALNRALLIYASNDKLYIIQEKAKTDLAQYTRIGRGDYKPKYSELKRWCFLLSQAVAALHKEHIIHADIKANNVLIYEDGTVKLTDFTLSTKKWSADEKFTHNVCTCTHRPLECLLEKEWDESLDIWSLGCTFYEIAYGESLFPYQGAVDQNLKNKNVEAKQRMRQRSINALLDWESRQSTENYFGIKHHPIEYIRYALSKDYFDPELATFNQLLEQMLSVNPGNRPTITEILRHPFFVDEVPMTYLSVRRPMRTISAPEVARISRLIQLHSSHPIVQKLALSLHQRCTDIPGLAENIRAAACTWIASKIVLGYPPETTLPLHRILAAERDICHNVKFRLHYT